MRENVPYGRAEELRDGLVVCNGHVDSRVAPLKHELSKPDGPFVSEIVESGPEAAARDDDIATLEPRLVRAAHRVDPPGAVDLLGAAGTEDRIEVLAAVDETDRDGYLASDVICARRPTPQPRDGSVPCRLAWDEARVQGNPTHEAVRHESDATMTSDVNR